MPPLFRSYRKNPKVEKNSGFYTVSFPTMEKFIGMPVFTSKSSWIGSSREGQARNGDALQKEAQMIHYLADTFDIEKRQGEKGMGIDLGLRIWRWQVSEPSPCSLKGTDVPPYAEGKAKKLDAIRKSKDKESRWMKDHNHKISRQIVNFAVANGVGIIRMEDLTGILNRTKSKKEAGRNLHSWSFYQLKEIYSL
jgi:IS605 OrfB family transposase